MIIKTIYDASRWKSYLRERVSWNETQQILKEALASAADEARKGIAEHIPERYTIGKQDWIDNTTQAIRSDGSTAKIYIKSSAAIPIDEFQVTPEGTYRGSIPASWRGQVLRSGGGGTLRGRAGDKNLAFSNGLDSGGNYFRARKWKTKWPTLGIYGPSAAEMAGKVLENGDTYEEIQSMLAEHVGSAIKQLIASGG